MKAIACALCGASGPGAYRRVRSGATFCATHRWCQHCRAAHTPDPCAEERAVVVTQQAAEAGQRQVLRDLAALGVRLPQVPLLLLPVLLGPEDGRCIKRCRGNQRVARIEVQAGLGPTRFGHVVAHESAHALLHLHGGPRVQPDVEEGFCELLAVVWLTSRTTSRELLAEVWANPHPAYGEQMRRLVGIARRQGVPAVIERVLATGKPG
jgi:hypothetical protein